MSESAEEKYRVVVHDFPTPNDLGEMTPTEVYGFVRTRTGSMDEAETVLAALEEEGAATAYFETHLGRKVRIEISRSYRNE